MLNGQCAALFLSFHYSKGGTNQNQKAKVKNKMQSVYFGGSRHPQNINPSQIAAVVAAVVASGQGVHVGCQYGADQAVVLYTPLAYLSVFAVAPNPEAAPDHLWQASISGAVAFSAGGTTAPMHARYLLRSIAAFQGCSEAVFFNPGSGSLAVARECVRSGLPVSAFSNTKPAPIPSTSGAWYSPFWFEGFQCWRYGVEQKKEQPRLF